MTTATQTDEAPDPFEAPPEVIDAARPHYSSWITVATDWAPDGRVEHVWIVWSQAANTLEVAQFDEYRVRNPKLAILPRTVNRNPLVVHDVDRARQIWKDMYTDGFRLWDNMEKKVIR